MFCTYLLQFFFCCVLNHAITHIGILWIRFSEGFIARDGHQMGVWFGHRLSVFSRNLRFFALTFERKCLSPSQLVYELRLVISNDIVMGGS